MHFLKQPFHLSASVVICEKETHTIGQANAHGNLYIICWDNYINTENNDFTFKVRIQPVATTKVNACSILFHSSMILRSIKLIF